MAVSIVALALPEVRLIVPERFRDERGFFSETYSRRALAEAGIEEEFVQDNHSLSRPVRHGAGPALSIAAISRKPSSCA